MPHHGSLSQSLRLEEAGLFRMPEATNQITRNFPGARATWNDDWLTSFALRLLQGSGSQTQMRLCDTLGWRPPFASDIPRQSLKLGIQMLLLASQCTWPIRGLPRTGACRTDEPNHGASENKDPLNFARSDRRIRRCTTARWKRKVAKESRRIRRARGVQINISGRALLVQDKSWHNGMMCNEPPSYVGVAYSAAAAATVTWERPSPSKCAWRRQ